MTDNDFESKLFGVDLFGQVRKPKASGLVSERFTFPPFSVLDARSGEWQNRKRSWLALGIQSEIGRKDDLTYTGSAASFDYYRVKEGAREASKEQGTSIFDPVLCECLYRWFCPPAGQIVDPFAGGSVRGVVANLLGRQYWGCDLRNDQVEANREQALALCSGNLPYWVCGDAMDAVATAPAGDFVFSCPPYGDLERYSDNPADLSTMEWHTFAAAYKRIILRTCERLKPNRFAAFVVADFRDPRGYYRDFVSETIRAFKECGLGLYNQGILATVVGSAAMRVSKQFEAGRKLAKTHQNVLVFVKGDWREAAKANPIKIEEGSND